jgi:hypothetical protein
LELKKYSENSEKSVSIVGALFFRHQMHQADKVDFKFMKTKKAIPIFTGTASFEIQSE